METRPARLAVAAACLALASVQSGSAASALNILTPLNGSVVQVPEVLLVFTSAPGARVSVKVAGRVESLRDAIVPGRESDLHHIRVPLQEGYCDVVLVDPTTRSDLGRVSMCYVPPHSLRTPVRTGSQSYTFHTREQEAGCRGCHGLPEVFDTEANKPLTPAGKACGACHREVDSAVNLHGPAAVYACLTCHEPQYRPSRFAQKEPVPAACRACHEGFFAKVLGARRFLHGPVAAGTCLACHDPHGGETQNLLRATPPELCLRCHEKALPAPVSRGLHAKLACTECHDPHGGETSRMTTAEGNPFCVRCHEEFDGVTVGHPLPGHPVSAEVDRSRPGKRFGCLSCHDPHATKDVSRQNIVKNEAAQRKFCVRCHY